MTGEPKRRPRVLLVDDDRVALRLYVRILQSRFDVITAGDFEQAVRLLEEKVLDVVVCDLNLDGVSGREVLEHVRHVQPDAVSLVISASDSQRDAIECLTDAGAFHFLVKPVAPRELVEAVERAVEHRRREREHRERVRELQTKLAEEAQARHQAKLEAIGQLAAGIAHEINTPMQFIGDNVRFLRDAFGDAIEALREAGALIEQARAGAVDPGTLDRARAAFDRADVDYLAEEIPGAIEQSLEGIERVTKIVRAMKEFSHPGGEEKTDVDIHHAIESTLTVCRNEWKYVADVVCEFGDDVPFVPAIAGDFNQVVLNLVVNAAHAIADKVKDSGEKGRITIRTRRVGDSVEIRVSDTGTGIPPEIRERIFEPFFTTKGVGKGTGQGLALAHAVVVKKHGGTIEVDSEVGKGTTFVLTFPLDRTSAGGGPSERPETRPEAARPR